MEEKIKELESRLEKLEKVEKRRKIKNIIILSFYGLLLVFLIAGGIWLYVKFKPYKEKLDNLKNWGSSIIKRDEVVEDGNNPFDFGDFNTDDFFNDFFNW